MQEEVPKLDDSYLNDTPIDFVEWFNSLSVDYIYKSAIATVLFFTCWPWAAFFWPPYYLVRRNSP